jgi:hypothetical protein
MSIIIEDKDKDKVEDKEDKAEDKVEAVEDNTEAGSTVVADMD